MNGHGLGCCCGMIVGCLLVIATAVAAVVGLILWVSPEACNQSAAAIESVWEKVKYSSNEEISTQ